MWTSEKSSGRLAAITLQVVPPLPGLLRTTAGQSAFVKAALAYRAADRLPVELPPREPATAGAKTAVKAAVNGSGSSLSTSI